VGTERVEALLAQMTIEERCTLSAGDDAWHTRPIPRLGIPRLKVTDGPNGARGDAASGATATCFPVGTALAASWDVDLIERVGGALADEARSKGAVVLLGPTVNLHRTPLGGRNFECYSEDPVLTGRIAAAYIRGLQANGVGACIKHFVANDSEHERFTISSEVDERTLRELYLRPFEIAVAESDPWTIMAAYNRINGPFACEHRELLTEVLRDEWGWDGVVISDWGAVHADAPTITAGCDLEMPGPGEFLGPRLAEKADGDDDLADAATAAARRLLGLLDRSGRLDDTDEQAERSDDPPERRALAREAAVAGMVLLKNDGGLLPLDPTALRTVAVVGPNAETGTFQGGGSSQVLAHHVRHPLEGLRARLGDTTVVHEPGCLTHKFLPELPPERLGEPGRGAAGAGTDLDGADRPVHLTVHADGSFAGEPVAERRLRTLQAKLFTGRMPGVDDPTTFSARYATTFVPRRSGTHTFSLCAVGRARLVVEGQLVVDNWTDPQPGDWFFSFGTQEVSGTVDLDDGVPVELVLEYGREGQPGPVGLRVGLLEPVPENMLDRAAEAAAAADAAIVVVGTTGEWETEGNDRASMDLPGDQDELIRRVADVQPNTVVVLNAGSPVDLRGWLDRVPAVLQVWFPGQAFGDALAAVLCGDDEPGGRLPTTLPLRFEDCPAFLSYPGEGGRVIYGEGVFAGYRGYDEAERPVAFGFGHGLGYTTFDVGEPTATVRGGVDDDDLEVDVVVRLTNTGTRPGAEVVQCYVGDDEASVRRPPRELAAWTKVRLDPGESRDVALTLDRRAFAYWHPRRRTWRVEPGRFTIAVGRSSRELAGAAHIDLA
jgi:beta-glucosidase